MGDKSSIEWTEATWTVVQGCTEVNAACANCYARNELIRQAGNPNPKVSAPVQGLVNQTKAGLRFTGKVALRLDRLSWPLQWKRPRMIFVPSLGDLFHENVPDEFIAEVYAVMQLASWHTFQNLTKRPERRAALLRSTAFKVAVDKAISKRLGYPACADWPMPNVWEGVTAGTQRILDQVAAPLASTPAVVRFLSLEPWLDFKPVDLQPAFSAINDEYPAIPIHWVIMGGESRGPEYRRMVERHVPGEGMTCGPACPYCHGLGWTPKLGARAAVRSARDDCQRYGVPFFFKQWGGPTSKAGGRLLDGREWSEMPEVAAVRRKR